MSKSFLEKLGLKRSTTVQANSTAAIAEAPAVADVPSYSNTLSNIKESAARTISSIRGFFSSRVKDVLPEKGNNPPAIAPEKDFNDEITAAFGTLPENKGQSARVAQKRESIDHKFVYEEPAYETPAPDFSQVFAKPVESQPAIPNVRRRRVNPALEDVNNYVRELDDEYYNELAKRRAKGRLHNLGLCLKQGWNAVKSFLNPNDVIRQAKEAVRETEIEANPQPKVIEFPGIYRQYVRPLAYAAAVAGVSVGLNGSQSDTITDTTESVYQTIPQSKPEPVVRDVSYKPNSKPVFRATPIVNKAPAEPTPKVNSVPIYKDSSSYRTDPYIYRSPFTKPGHSECQK